MQIQKLTTSVNEKLPSDWKTYSLGDEYISKKFRAGGTPLTSNKDYWQNGKIPFVKIEDITKNKKYLFNTKNAITDEGLRNSSTWLIPANSLLLSIYASFGESIINKIPVATNQAIIGICVNESHVDLEYLYYQLQFLKGNWLNKIQENTQKNLNSEIAKKFAISFPKFKEQQKIASILSNVDNLIQKTDLMIEQTQRLKKGLMQRLLTRGIRHSKFKKTELGEIPEEWTVKKIIEISELVMGQSPPGDSYNIKGEGVPLLNGPTEFGPIYPVAIQNTTKPTKFCSKGDILLCVRGSTTGRLNLSNDKYCIGRGLCAIRGKENVTNSLWLFYNFLKLQNYIYNIASGGGSTFPNINRNFIEDLLLPFPKFKEQQKIASILSNVDNLIQKLKDKKKSEETLKKGLMQQLLTGKLRVKI